MRSQPEGVRGSGGRADAGRHRMGWGRTRPRVVARRTITIGALAVVAMVLLATPSWAWHPILSGGTGCSNGDHIVTRDEFTDALKQHFDALDTNGDGVLERSEFYARSQTSPGEGERRQRMGDDGPY